MSCLSVCYRRASRAPHLLSAARWLYLCDKIRAPTVCVPLRLVLAHPLYSRPHVSILRFLDLHT